jgi:hypothetical protein
VLSNTGRIPNGMTYAGRVKAHPGWLVAILSLVLAAGATALYFGTRDTGGESTVGVGSSGAESVMLTDRWAYLIPEKSSAIAVESAADAIVMHDALYDGTATIFPEKLVLTGDSGFSRNPTDEERDRIFGSYAVR